MASLVTNRAKHVCFKEYAPQMNLSGESTLDVINYPNGETVAVNSIREKTQVKVKTVSVSTWLR